MVKVVTIDDRKVNMIIADVKCQYTLIALKDSRKVTLGGLNG